MTSTKEVSGIDKTLFQAIADGDVESPALMDWNAWQKWRKDQGKRTKRRVDGDITHPNFEVPLWKSTMAAVHGDEWGKQILEPSVEELQEAVEAEGEDTAQTGAALPEGSASACISQPRPPPTTTQRPSTPPRGALDTSPGSGLPSGPEE